MPTVGDVELDASGCLRGLVLNADAIPVASAEVIVRKQGEQVRTRTDGFGRFQTMVSGGGTYQVTAGKSGQSVRAWTSGTAPPTAKPLALVVVGSDVVRGQLPLERFCCSDQFVVAAMVAAMIAIPIAVHKSGGKPVSP
jgi:hypothetical protein